MKNAAQASTGRGRFTIPVRPRPPSQPAPPVKKPPPAPAAQPGQRRVRTAEPPVPVPQERSVVDLIQEIRSGLIDPGSLRPEDRQACVRHLGAEGLSVPEIAQVLRCSDRTITRDRRALQEAAAITHDPALAGRTAGQLITEASLCTDRIRRVTRDRETPPAVKVEGERACFEILTKLVASLQSLGYLPSAAHHIKAELTHHQEQLPGYAELAAEAQRIDALARSFVPDGSPVLQLVRGVEDQTRRALLASQLASATEALPAPGSSAGEP